MDQILSKIRLPVFLSAVVLFFVSNRYLSFEPYYVYLIGVSAALALFSCGIAIWKCLSSEASASVWRTVAAWQFVVLVGAGTFLAYQKLIGGAPAPETLGMKAMLVLWLLLVGLGVAAGIGCETALPGSSVEPKRVTRSTVSWLMVGMLLGALVCINYMGTKRDHVSDWSYLKTTSPSDTTVAAFNAAESAVEVAIFFPQSNDVRPSVKQYFDILATRTQKLSLSFFDKDLEPLKAEEFKVTKNGQVVFRVGEQRERFDIGMELSAARKNLKKLDGEVQKLVLRLTTEKQKLYFTRGHGEFIWAGTEKDHRRRIDLLETFLRSQNFGVHTLSLTDGSAQKIPDDAAALMIIGADQAFLPAEVSVIEDYLKTGGKLFFLGEAEGTTREGPSVGRSTEDPLDGLLKGVGISFKRTILANDKSYASLSKTSSDHWFLFSNRFSSHESMSTLSRNDERAAVLVFQSGYLDVEPNVNGWRATTTIRSVDGTYADENRNARKDNTEKESTFALSAVATLPIASEDGKDSEARVIVAADASLANDMLIRNKANLVFIADSLRWLTGQAERSGDVSSEEDIKIQHTNKEDAIWFNATVIVVPAMVLVLGFFATRRKRRSVAA